MLHEARRFIVAVLLASSLLASCGGGDGTGPEPLPVPPAPSAGTVGDGRLAELADWARATQDVPAMAVVLVRNGQVAESAAVGMRSTNASVAVTLSDRWHLGSMTKAMTATLAAVLVEDGLIEWETSAQQVWPEAVAQIHTDFRDVTLRQLLAHTSGMKRDSGSGSSQGTIEARRRAWALDLLREAPQFQSGEFHYSNVGYMVAGAMLEARGGASWETMLAERVWAPLGMTQTGFGAPGTRGQLDQPLGHRSLARGFSPVEPDSSDANIDAAAGPAGNVHTTLEDYARFMLAHIDGARGTPSLLAAESFRVLHEPVAGGFALGWETGNSFRTLNVPGIGHTGTIGVWFSLVWLAPTLDTGLMIAVNGGGDRALAAIQEMDLLMRERVVASR